MCEHSIKKMFKKLLQIIVIMTIVAAIPEMASAQEEREISASRNRTLVINQSGSYRLSNDVSVESGDGIVITASNVSLNLNGHTVITWASGTGRGIFINGRQGVSVRNGKVSGFNSNVMINNAVNVNVESVQIVGRGLAPNNGPSEIGVQIVNSRSVLFSRNNISSVNLGVFVRGGNSAGNRIFENVIVGGGNPANNLLGICYNPAASGGTNGPRGDNIYNNHIAHFGYAIAISAGSLHNVFNENVLASFNGGFREPDALTQNGGTNVSEGNIETTVPADILP